MPNRIALRRLLTSSLALFIFYSTCSAQSPTPRTVLDYYLLLPEKYFEANRELRVKWMLDPGRGAVVDITNGYIYAPGDGAQTSLYVCLFQRSRGRAVIGVKSHPSDTHAITFLHFYEYRNGALADVTKTVLPVKINESAIYEMPRYGKSIEVRDARNNTIYSLVWSGRRFVLKRP